ncbi:MAG: ACT domain-containing protein [Candidatus Diapherotrites archaeon]|nr:ACT domain-containing protein [Candidatus Diapherotrites archaeon]
MKSAKNAKKGKELLFISVIGKDKKGIVATISNHLYKNGINIEDINQKVMEGYFVMTMVVDAKDSKKSLEKIREELEEVGKKMNVMVSIRHENIFKMMHRI